jgi:hypothetical protein
MPDFFADRGEEQAAWLDFGYTLSFTTSFVNPALHKHTDIAGAQAKSSDEYISAVMSSLRDARLHQDGINAS